MTLSSYLPGVQDNLQSSRVRREMSQAFSGASHPQLRQHNGPEVLFSWWLSMPMPRCLADQSLYQNQVSCELHLRSLSQASMMLRLPPGTLLYLPACRYTAFGVNIDTAAIS